MEILKNNVNLILLIALTLLSSSCASFNVVSPKDSFLNKNQKIAFIEVIKSKDKERLESFFNDNAKSVKVPGMSYISGFVYAEVDRKFLIFSKSGVFLSRWGDLKKLSNTVPSYLESFIEGSRECYDSEEKIEYCSIGNIVPEPIKPLMPNNLFCQNKSCFYNIGDKGAYQLNTEKIESLSQSLLKLTSQEVKYRFITSVQQRVQEMNKALQIKKEKTVLDSKLWQEIHGLNAKYKSMGCEFFIELRVIEKIRSFSYRLQIGCYPGLDPNKCRYGPISNARRSKDVKEIILLVKKRNSLMPGIVGHVNAKKVSSKLEKINGFQVRTPIFAEDNSCKDMRWKIIEKNRERKSLLGQ